MKNRASMTAFRGNELGKGSLNGASTKRKADAINGVNHVVKPKSLCSDGAGKKNPIKKPKDAAQKAGACEKQGTGQQCLFSGRKFQKLLHHADSGNGI